MKKGKFQNRRNKSFALLLALVLLIGCVSGGTVAWLISESKTVKNTFVAGQIGTLELTETDVDKTYVIVPGTTITKDPKVTYTPKADATNEVKVPAYVFVEVVNGSWTLGANNTYSINVEGGEMTWTVAGDWKAVDGYAGVYYIEVDDAVVEKAIIKDNAITVSNGVTMGNITKLAAASDLTFNVYAIQKDSLSVTTAWTTVKSAS